MLGRWEVQIEIGTYSACQTVRVVEVKESFLLGMDFLCAAGVTLDFRACTVTFKDGTSIPLLNDLHASEMTHKVGENRDAVRDLPCSPDPPQWEAPFAESPLPLSDNDPITPRPDPHNQSHPPAVIQTACVVSLSTEGSAATQLSETFGRRIVKVLTLNSRIDCGTSSMCIDIVLPLAQMTWDKPIWFSTPSRQGMNSQSTSGQDNCPKAAKLLLTR